MALSKELLRKINYHATDESLFIRALTHSSYEKWEDNERLEFLGDSILGLFVSERIFREHPDFTEGELSMLRSELVCGASLAQYAMSIGLGDYLYLGKGELKSGGCRKVSILADAVEALIGAVYLDGGPENARLFVNDIFEILSKNHSVFGKDPKTKLQEEIQKNNASSQLTYTTYKTEGPPHNMTFYIEVSLDDTVLGRGDGPSKKAAEQAAAKQALENINNIR